MAKKKKKDVVPTAPALINASPPPKETKKCKYEDPCFHCQHMTMSSTAMECEKKSPAFWTSFQGFYENKEHSGFPGDVCEDLKEFKK